MFSTEFSFLSQANLVFSGNDDCWMVQTESGIFCSAQMAVFEVIWKISEILINRKGKGLFCNAPWFQMLCSGIMLGISPERETLLSMQVVNTQL